MEENHPNRDIAGVQHHERGGAIAAGGTMTTKETASRGIVTNDADVLTATAQGIGVATDKVKALTLNGYFENGQRSKAYFQQMWPTNLAQLHQF